MKRITVFAGHYGSGKTNIAVNYSLYLSSLGIDTVLCDLDRVNPYFRAIDSQNELRDKGVGIICSRFANSSVDLPSLPAELYSITDDKSKNFVLDIGGDDRGAYVLGRLAPKIIEENNYEMLLVINKFRPLTRTPEDVLTVKREIELSSGIAFTGIINNSNLGDETLEDDVLSSMEYAERVSKLASLPLLATTYSNKLSLNAENSFPISLQRKPID